MKFWLIQTGEPIPGIDGSSRPFRIGMLAQALVERGHSVTWWSSAFGHTKKAYRCRGTQVRRVQPGLEVILLAAMPPYKRNVSLLRVLNHKYVALQFRLRSRQEPRPDLIFCCLPTIELAYAAVHWGKRHGVPVVIDIRDIWPDLYLETVSPAFRRLLQVALCVESAHVRRTCRLATGITAVSQEYLQWALAHGRRSETCRDGVFPIGFPSDARLGSTSPEVEQMRSKVKAAPGELICFFSGMFGLCYDLETIVTCARLLAQEGTRCRFVLAGRGDKDGALRQAASDVPSVHFTGWLDQAELVRLGAASHVGLCAYTKGATMSLPNKPFEYMSSGLPLVCSLKGELAQIIQAEKIGLLYEAENVESLAEAIRFLLRNEQERLAMSARSLALFESRYKAAVLYPKLAAHLESVVTQMAI